MDRRRRLATRSAVRLVDPVAAAARREADSVAVAARREAGSVAVTIAADNRRRPPVVTRQAAGPAALHSAPLSEHRSERQAPAAAASYRSSPITASCNARRTSLIASFARV